MFDEGQEGNAYGRSWENDVASLRVFMATLRKKLEKEPGSPQYIQTHIGVGYRMLTAAWFRIFVYIVRME